MNESVINYMKRALELAQKGEATVSPNPMVGALVVKDGVIIGEGHHLKKGGPHAEVNAINNAKGDVAGGTLFCTLEPCCHVDKMTPPCVDLLIEKKIKKVFIATLDPNPDVAGKGLEKLKDAGIEVNFGILQEEADKQNKVFFKNMKDSLPYIHIKAALTLDGRIATQGGDSKWITSPEAREEVHLLRKKYDAIMIGKKTLLADNPRLNTRLGTEVLKENIKIVVGNLSDEDLNLDIFSKKSSKEKIINLYTNHSIKGLKGIRKGKDWQGTLRDLYKSGINSVLVEGGSQLISSLLEEGVYDELTFYIAPKLIGNGPSLFTDERRKKMSESISLKGKWRQTNQGEAVFEVRR